MGRVSDAKEKLLQVAFDLIWTSSYGSVSVDHICERAGVKKGSFYYFFPSKADLAIAAYEADWAKKQPELDKIFSAEVPPLDRLVRWCEVVVECQREGWKKYGHVCGCPYASVGAELAGQDARIQAKAQELLARGISYLERAVEDAVEAGVIQVADPAMTARHVASCVLGSLVHARVQNDQSALDDLPAAVFGLLGLKPAVA